MAVPSQSFPDRLSAFRFSFSPISVVVLARWAAKELGKEPQLAVRSERQVGAAGAIDGQAAVPIQAAGSPPRRLKEASAPLLPVPFRRAFSSSPNPIASHLRKKTPKKENTIVLVAVLVLIL